MTNAIASINGAILTARVRRNVLVNPRTGMPYINRDHLEQHPKRDLISSSLKSAEVAFKQESELASEWRTYQERVAELPDDIQADVRRLLTEGSKWEFADLKEETGNKTDLIFSDPEIESLFFTAPVNELIAKKIFEGNLNFTPEESLQLTYYSDYFIKNGDLEILLVLDSIKPLVLNKSFITLLEGMTKREVIEKDTLEKLQDLLKGKNLNEILKNDNYFLLRTALKNNNKVITKLLFESLPIQERKKLLSKDYCSFLQEAIQMDSLAIVSLFELIPEELVASLLLGNSSTLFRRACLEGKEKSVQVMIEVASSINFPKKGNLAKILTGQAEYKMLMEGRKEKSLLGKLEDIKEQATIKTITDSIANPHPDLNIALFEELLRITKVASNLENDNDSVANAYKLALLFGDYNESIKWLENRANPKKVQNAHPVHDALLFSLPIINKWTPASWKKLLLKNGNAVLDYIPIAPEIEAKYFEIGGQAATGLLFEKLKITDLKALAMKVHYKEEHENPEFAAFCVEIKPRVTQQGFQLGIEALKQVKDDNQIVKKDKIPDIGIIDGLEIGHEGYYMRKLSKSNMTDLMIALTVGRFVHCCNHLDGATRDMAVAQVTSKYGGVYALFKKNNGEIDYSSLPIAKTTVWRTEKEGKFSNLTFNSWEFRDKDHEIRDLSKDFVLEAAKRAIVSAQNIEKVRLGGKYSFGFSVDTPGKPRDPKTASYDSTIQYLVFSADMLEQSDVDRITNELKKESSSIKLQSHTHDILEEVKHGIFPLKLAS